MDVRTDWTDIDKPVRIEQKRKDREANVRDIV
jgi:hypothetical protein